MKHIKSKNLIIHNNLWSKLDDQIIENEAGEMR